ncbi:MAG: hypothetical protein SO108_03690 [Bacilli bacterium]|nr:hypothetical protein [Bacilli bacterium]
MKEQKNNGRGIFYGVIGVATLVVAIIGATFAYFTATATNATNITGNMASVSFGLDVHKVTTADEKLGGMIPMSNSMVEAAVKGNGKQDTADTQQICVDDNGNAVCQIYKISVTNSGTAGMFLDGYVALTGGSNTIADKAGKVPEDTTSEMWKNLTGDDVAKTTMRWAQVFCTGTDDQLTGCTTVGKTTSRATTDVSGGTAGIDKAWTAVDLPEATVSATSGFNRTQILTSGITSKGKIAGNEYDIIDKNFIRISDHVAKLTGDEGNQQDSFDRSKDITSALVFNQRIDPKAGDTARVIAASDDSNGIGGTTAYTDAQVYYIVVWLAETGKNQTAGQTNVTTGSGETDTSLKFFKGTVTFVSAQGSEVTATFSNYAAVKSDKAPKGE